MRVELPEGYVPPQPTHPHYGYLTPQERADLEAAEREQQGIVPGVPLEAGMPGVEAAAGSPEPVEPVEPVLELASEPESETQPRPSGWVPPPPSPPRSPALAPATDPPNATPEVAPAEAEPAASAAPAAGAAMRWDAYRQEWVAAEEAAPPPDVAAAAGGRGSSSSWTSADGHRFRWDARAQQWVTERPES